MYLDFCFYQIQAFSRTQSSASVNSWIADEDSDQGKTVRKNPTKEDPTGRSSFGRDQPKEDPTEKRSVGVNPSKEDPNGRRSRQLNPAHRLGKRLIELDRKAEKVETARLSKIRQRSLTQIETTNKEEIE